MLGGDTEMEGLSKTYGLPMGTWCVSRIQSFEKLFDARDRNSALASFNEDISLWDTSSVATMSATFMHASSFDIDLSAWNVSSVTNMKAMFGRASSFNKDLSTWDVSRVTDMDWMISGAESFNQDLSAWDVSGLTRMYGMFSGSIVFNQDLCSWGDKLQTNTEVGLIFDGTTLCPQQGSPNLRVATPGPFCHEC
jgi:surface protein